LTRAVLIAFACLGLASSALGAALPKPFHRLPPSGLTCALKIAQLQVVSGNTLSVLAEKSPAATRASLETMAALRGRPEDFQPLIEIELARGGGEFQAAVEELLMSEHGLEVTPGPEEMERTAVLLADHIGEVMNDPSLVPALTGEEMTGLRWFETSARRTDLEEPSRTSQLVDILEHKFTRRELRLLQERLGVGIPVRELPGEKDIQASVIPWVTLDSRDGVFAALREIVKMRGYVLSRRQAGAVLEPEVTGYLLEQTAFLHRLLGRSQVKLTDGTLDLPTEPPMDGMAAQDIPLLVKTGLATLREIWDLLQQQNRDVNRSLQRLGIREAGLTVWIQRDLRNLTGPQEWAAGRIAEGSSIRFASRGAIDLAGFLRVHLQPFLAGGSVKLASVSSFLEKGAKYAAVQLEDAEANTCFLAFELGPAGGPEILHLTMSERAESRGLKPGFQPLRRLDLGVAESPEERYVTGGDPRVVRVGAGREGVFIDLAGARSLHFSPSRPWAGVVHVVR
jgi:hypothetical protein